MFKSTLLLVVLTICAHLANATNYYFSSLSGDDSRTALQAQNPETPWRTITKFNAINNTLKPGDSVFFKRGEVFYGNMVIRASGAQGAGIYYGAYGVGVNPFISGFTAVSGWTSVGNGIWSAPLAATNLQMVTLNGEAKGMGRWPNTGYLKVNSHVGNQSITSTGLASAPSTWAGAELVIRKYRFVLDRHPIISQSGNTLNYGTNSINGSNGAYVPVDKNGFFIQGHLGTLDQFGEWYFDAANKRLYVHFGSDVPDNYVIKASTLDYNASVSNVNFATFDNLNFEGGNTKGLWLYNSTNINISNCNFYNEGGQSIYGQLLNWIWVRNSTINTSFSNGINFDQNVNNCTIEGVSVSNTNMVAGSGRSGNGIGNGITVNGNNTTIINNRVVNSGYSGIQFVGDNVLVEKNYVDGFCFLKDDGGGIYTFNGPDNRTEYNRKIRNNIILNAIGNYESSQAYWWENYGKAAGIYLDEYVNNVEITNNTVANGDWAGIFLHNAHDCQISNNIFYNHRYQVHVSQYTPASRNMIETNNQYISKQAYQATWYYRTYVNDLPNYMGTLSNNYYARPVDDNASIQVDFLQPGGAGTIYRSLSQWQADFGLDQGSKKSPVSYKGNINDSIRFEYNASGAVKTVPLDASYLDVAGNQYAGSLILNPWTGVVLLKTKSSFKQSQVITFPSIAAKTYGDAPFALNATASSNLPVSYSVISGPAAINNNMVTLTGSGTVTIEATQPGNANFGAAPPVQQSFLVAASNIKLPQTITFPPIANKTYGDAPFALNAKASSGLPVTYQVTSGNATVIGNIVTITGTGSVWIAASQTGDALYEWAPTVSQSVWISKGSQTINFPSIPDRKLGDAPILLNANASSGLPVSYKLLSGPATLIGNTITITGTGTVWIEASQPGNDNFNTAATVSRSFNVTNTVTKASQDITFPPVTTKMYGEGPFALNATASSGLPVSYRLISGPGVINGNIMTLTIAGTVVLEASQPGNASFEAARPVQQTFEVIRANQAINFPAISNKYYGYAPFPINATATSTLPVSFRVVSGPATINGNTVTLIGGGQVTIEAAQTGDNNYNPAPPVRQTFTVSKLPQTINFASVPNKTYGDAPFSISGSASSGLPINFRLVSGPAIIGNNTVTLTGVSTLITITGPGKVIIEAIQEGNEAYDPAQPVQQSFIVQPNVTTKQSQIINFGSLSYKTYTSPPFQLSATTSSGLPVTYRIVSGPATVNGDVVTITGVGVVTVEASQPGSDVFNAAAPVIRKFQIGKAGQSISFAGLSNKIFGDAPFTLNAAASSGLPVGYRVVSGPATVLGNLVTLTGTGLVTIEASQPGNQFYYPAYSPKRTFTVVALPPVTVATGSRPAAPQESRVEALPVVEKLQLSVYPNPLRKQGFVRVQVPAATAGVLGIYDRQGKLVKQVGYRKFEQGIPGNIELNADGLVKGLYFIRFATKDTIVSKAFEVL